MSRRLLGLETEYGLAVLGSGRTPVDPGRCAGALVGLVREKIPSLPQVNGSGVFLANGARFYIDTGLHPEWCTPEVDNPWDAVRYACAGDLLLERLATLWPKTCRGTELALFKCNVDYSGAGTSWACHESYGHRTDPAILPAQLLPHLASRIVYTGAGGLNPLSPGIHLCLSPRVYHLQTEVSPSSTHSRGIFHTKDEPLAGPGWHRLHLLCGDSVCSHRAAWLKLGTTALIVALIEAGLRPGDAVRLRSPVAAMQTFNQDPACRATAELLSGPPVTALQIQRHYLAAAEQHLGHPNMPAWAPEICQAWQQMLLRLEQAPASVSHQLDWSLKRLLYHEHLRGRGWQPTEIQRCNEAIAQVKARRPTPRVQPEADRLAQLLRDLSADAELSQLDQKAQPEVPPGLSEAEYRRFLHVRAELCELEVRFGQLGPRGLFQALDRQGHVRHEVTGITAANIAQALEEPPATGRARVRAECIRQLAGKHNGSVCDWTAIRNTAGRILDLADPFLTEAPGWARTAMTDNPC